MMCCCRPKNASSGTPDAVSNVAGPAAAVNRSNTPRQRIRNLVGESHRSRVSRALCAAVRCRTLGKKMSFDPGCLLRVIWFVSFYFLTVLVLPLVVGSAVTYRALPSGRACPRCRATTILLGSRMLGVVSRLPFLELQRRWCLSCGWAGVVRVPRPSVRLVVAGRSAESGDPRVIDVRHIIVDGVSWGVRLETWRTGQLWYGRLQFVETSGRLWSDARPLRGMSDGEVLDQARRLPPDLLVSRLRELVSG